MTNNSIQSTEEIPIIEKFHSRIEKGHDFLERRPVVAKPWVRGVRVLLKKLYGSSSEVMDLFPLIKDKPSPEDLTAIFRKRLSQIESFVQSLEILPSQVMGDSPVGRVFIGHGRSLLWRELKDFISDRGGRGRATATY